MALRMDAYVALLRQEMAADLPAAAGLPPVLPVLVYTGDRQWQPAGLRQLTAPAPAGLRRWQPDLEMLPVDAATLTAEDAETNPMAALLRLQRCRRQAELPGLSEALFGGLRREGLRLVAERLSDVLMRMSVARFGGDETGAEHTEELRRALQHMEEPTMLAERMTQWRQEALDEGRRQGMSEGETGAVAPPGGGAVRRRRGRCAGGAAGERRGCRTARASGRSGGRLCERGGVAPARQRPAQRRELARSAAPDTPATLALVEDADFPTLSPRHIPQSTQIDSRT